MQTNSSQKLTTPVLSQASRMQPRVSTMRDHSSSSKPGRKTMLIYTSRKTPAASSQGDGSGLQIIQKKPNTGSFSAQLQQNGITLPQQHDHDEDNGEIQDETSPNNKEVISPILIPQLTKSKSRERQINPSIEWGAVLKNYTETAVEVCSAPAIFKSNMIYKSSPTKATQKFGQVSRLINNSMDPKNELANKAKNVCMFKPTKLSSTMTEDQNTPEKGLQKQITIDITIDLSGRDLSQVPLLETLTQHGSHPTIIDLRFNDLIEVPTSLFQIPSLRQLRLDSNRIVSLPPYLQEPHKCRLQVLTLSQNRLKALPDWVYYHVRHTLERLDISLNQDFTQMPEALCNMDRLQVLLLYGCNLCSLPSGVTRLQTIEEFGLEWWQYTSIDESTFQKKEELGIIRDDTVITNRQVLRQIFETLRQVNQTSQQIGLKRIDFISFYRQYKRLYPHFGKEKEKPAKVKTLFQLVCHFGHSHLMSQLLSSPDPDFKPNLNKVEKGLQGQTLLQIALHQSISEEFIVKFLRQSRNALGSFEFYLQRPNEELPIQRQLQLLHPIMIALKRKHLQVATLTLEMIKEDIQSNQTQTLLPFNIRDENRNTILHHLFSLLQDDGFKDQALNLCQELISLASSGLITVNYNETNKQGMTPLDLAIELRLNQALSYALALNTQSVASPLFLTDHALNQRGLTPLHRAVQARNHQALSMLIDSQGCDPLARDKDFKKPRDYCQRLLFMQKMLRKAEVTKLVYDRKEESAKQDLKRNAWVKHEALFLRVVRGRVVEQNVENNPPTHRSMKRSASEIRELRPGAVSQSLMYAAKNTEVDIPLFRRPFVIERPIPLDRFSNYHYNKTVIENIIKPAVFLLDNDDSQESLVQQDYQVTGSSPKKARNKRISNKLPPPSSRLSGRQKQQKPKELSQMKPKLTQHGQLRKSLDRTSPGFTEENEEDLRFGSNFHQGTGSKQEASEFNTFVFDEAEASEESPTTMPSNQFHYVMTVNNSKLARRPYYKKLMRNHFEPQFCEFMDVTYGQVITYSDMPKKLQILYRVFSEGSKKTQDPKIRKDALEFFNLLIIELLDACEGPFLRPYMHEIVYLKDRLLHLKDVTTLKAKGKSQENSQRDIQLRLKAATTPTIKSIRVSQTRHSQIRDSNNGSVLEPSILTSRHHNPYIQKDQGSGLILVKTLRQSVSLKSLLAISQHAAVAAPTTDLNLAHYKQSRKSYQLHFQSHQSQKPDKKVTHDFSKMTRLIEESNSQLIFEQASCSPGGQAKSPRMDTGQIAAKRNLNFDKGAGRGLNNSEVKDMSSPGKNGTSSEYSRHSKEKRVQILDSSVRTVQINIEAPATKEKRPHQQTSHEEEESTTPFSVPQNTFSQNQVEQLLSSGESFSQKVAKLQQQATPPLAPSIISAPLYSSDSASIRNGMNKRATKLVIPQSAVPYKLGFPDSQTGTARGKKLGIASSLGNSGTSRASTQLNKGQVSQRSISSHRASALGGPSRMQLSTMHSSQHHHRSPNLHSLIQSMQQQKKLPQKKKAKVQAVPQSIQINLARTREEDEDYYKMLLSKQNPCS